MGNEKKTGSAKNRGNLKKAFGLDGTLEIVNHFGPALLLHCTAFDGICYAMDLCIVV
jgi:hypothetical protein